MTTFCLFQSSVFEKFRGDSCLRKACKESPVLTLEFHLYAVLTVDGTCRAAARFAPQCT